MEGVQVYQGYSKSFLNVDKVASFAPGAFLLGGSLAGAWQPPSDLAMFPAGLLCEPVVRYGQFCTAQEDSLVAPLIPFPLPSTAHVHSIAEGNIA